MSHVLDPKSVADRDRIRITNLQAAIEAMQSLGLQVLSDTQEQVERGVTTPQIGRGRYRGHKTAYGSLVGDYPIPQGWTYDDVDNNASVIGRLTPETVARLKQENVLPHYASAEQAYELGLVYDPVEQCYWPVYDFADTGGHFMQAVLGRVTTDRGKVATAYEKLMQAYHMACDRLAAEEAGYEIQYYTEGQTTPDGYVVPAGEKVSYATITE